MKPTTIAARPDPKSLKSSHKPGVDRIRDLDLDLPAAEKLELLKALRLSQTRAREAERRAAKLMEERDCMSRAFQDEARLIFCYRQSLKLLELRVSNLQKGKHEDDDDDDDDDDGDGGGIKWAWAWALAICFSVVGVGFFLGFTSYVDHDLFVANL